MSRRSPGALPTAARRWVLGLVCCSLLLAGLGTVGLREPAAAATAPAADPFYAAPSPDVLAEAAPGAVLKRRTVTSHLTGLPLPQRVTQLLYRTTDTLGAPSATVATVIPPLTKVFRTPRLVSYQFAYDAVGALCNPSFAYSGGASFSGQINTGEQAAVLGYSLAGYTVVVSDYEGPELHFGAGRESGTGVLDGIRAAVRDGSYGLTSTTPVAMVGYSGGSIATEWAAELAPQYAPDVDRQLVGAAMGGTPTDLAHLLEYIDGSFLWAGAIPLGLIGLSRAYDIDLDKYTNEYGKKVIASLQDGCITDVLGRYPGLTFAKLMKPEYDAFTTIPELAYVRTQVVMGQGGTPTTPTFFAVAKGDSTGDGIIVTEDVRRLVREYCSRGVDVTYRQYTGLEHIAGLAVFIPDAMYWVARQFNGATSKDSCAG